MLQVQNTQGIPVTVIGRLIIATLPHRAKMPIIDIHLGFSHIHPHTEQSQEMQNGDDVNPDSFEPLVHAEPRVHLEVESRPAWVAFSMTIPAHDLNVGDAQAPGE